MAMQTVTGGSVPVRFADTGEIEMVESDIAEAIQRMRQMAPEDRLRCLKVMRAMVGGRFPHSPAVIRQWSAEQFRNAADAIA